MYAVCSGMAVEVLTAVRFAIRTAANPVRPNPLRSVFVGVAVAVEVWLGVEVAVTVGTAVIDAEAVRLEDAPIDTDALDEAVVEGVPVAVAV